MASPAERRARELTIEETFDEVLAEMREEDRERERRGEKIVPPEHMDPEVAEAVAALNAIFDGDHPVTADLSFDQVYALVLPHFITLLKHVLKEQTDAGN